MTVGSGRRLGALHKRKILKALSTLDCEIVPNRGAGSHVFVRGPAGVATVMDREHTANEIKHLLAQLGIDLTHFLDAL